jgi:hypothetical protein
LVLSWELEVDLPPEAFTELFIILTIIISYSVFNQIYHKGIASLDFEDLL